MASPSTATAAAASTPRLRVLFLGATGGCALSALRRSLEAGLECVALARTPSKLSALLPFPTYPNLAIVEGNALSEADLSRALVTAPASASASSRPIVDVVVSAIGGAFSWSKMSNDDPKVCENSMRALLSAIRVLYQSKGFTPPRVVAVSTTSVSRFGRDVPVALLPIYHTLVAGARKDKMAMEDQLFKPASGSHHHHPEWTVVRPTILNDDPSDTTKAIRVGIEDPVAGVENRMRGYFISREDVGRWIFEELLQDAAAARRYVGKIASISY